MQAYWVKFNGRNPGCVEAKSETEAITIAKEITGNEVVSCKILPYPARPRLNGKDGWDASKGECPSFCYQPEKCQGHTSCPQHYSCTD